MTSSSQQPISLPPDQRAKLLAQRRLSDEFDQEVLAALDFLSPDIRPYLTDYFILIEDFKVTLIEEYRRCYSDYSFLVVPIHKAFECYLFKLFGDILEFTISRKTNIGYYLNVLAENKRKESIETLIAKYPFAKIDEKKWLAMWQALGRQWETNRNPLTHFEGERINNINSAQQVASSIVREMKLSAKLINDELFIPVIEKIQKEEKEKEEIRKNKELLGPVD
ncbi:hypothetical protein A2V71_02025 [Candidatus Berkelbacteria bacterium RBG_13_40_8]|uniref:Uncharacterized protein n=1 Tax=Candidatus Berkelbacteria bacterium RBG_13_40_8 TaxID=1797467 RepID=A0A1F5DQ64_9BACT|nr:MAG: hypothetical protein A2V71_02025 [Candidatus Berkelbacteria bacterium RBG_13_40_8]